MATFAYTAIGKNGKTESATIEAVNLMAAGHLLKDQGLMPLDLKEKSTRTVGQWMSALSPVSLKQKIVFIEDLHVMLKAGIAAPRALRIIAKQTKNKKFQTVLNSLSTQVESGKSLHDVMGQFPRIFSHIFVSMVEVGELSGNLEKSLEYLAIQLEREADLKTKTKGAMMHPAVIVSAMVIIGVLLAIFVLPKLTSIFKDFGGELPLPTRIIIAISDFMSGNAVLVIIALVGAIGGLIAFMRTPAGGRILDWVLLHFPIINTIVKKINLARFARIMSSLMKSGVSVVEGLGVTAQAMDNTYYRDVLRSSGENVKLGKPLTAALSEHEHLFPFLVTQMLEIGEETGSVEDIMQQIAEHYESEIDVTMSNLSSIIEPLLLLVIGAVVGVLALALIMPIYSITQNIG